MNYGYITFGLALIFTALLFRFADPMSWDFNDWIAFGFAALATNLIAGMCYKLFSRY